MRTRLVALLLWWAGVLALFSVPLVRLLRHALEQGYSSHIVLIPAIACFLLWSERERVFSEVSSSKLSGPVAGIGAILAICNRWIPLEYRPTFLVLSVLLLLIAGFLAALGMAVLRKGLFPISLLLFMIPVPGAMLDSLIHFLQSESANLSYWLFSTLGLPVLRDGFHLTLPGVTIEVAAECSGINSTVALFILSIVFAHETLLSNWTRTVFVLLMIPLSILKNAIRIVTLTVLAVRVDPGFLTGRLHHQGGFVFFLITLALVLPIWLLLRRFEARRSEKISQPERAPTRI